MRITKDAAMPDRSRSAVDCVNKENGGKKKRVIVKNSTESKIPDAFVFYKYKNLYTGEECSLSQSQLIEKGRAFLRWSLEAPAACLLRQFWNEMGIIYATAVSWTERNEEFKLFFTLAHENIGNRREMKLQEDFTYLRNTQAMYNSELRTFEDDRIKMKATLQHALETQGQYSLEEIQQVISYCFPPLKREKRDDETRSSNQTFSGDQEPTK